MVCKDCSQHTAFARGYNERVKVCTKCYADLADAEPDRYGTPARLHAAVRDIAARVVLTRAPGRRCRRVEPVAGQRAAARHGACAGGGHGVAHVPHAGRDGADEGTPRTPHAARSAYSPHARTHARIVSLPLTLLARFCAMARGRLALSHCESAAALGDPAVLTTSARPRRRSAHWTSAQCPRRRATSGRQASTRVLRLVRSRVPDARWSQLYAEAPKLRFNWPSTGRCTYKQATFNYYWTSNRGARRRSTRVSLFSATRVRLLLALVTWRVVTDGPTDSGHAQAPK